LVIGHWSLVISIRCSILGFVLENQKKTTKDEGQMTKDKQSCTGESEKTTKDEGQMTNNQQQGEFP